MGCEESIGNVMAQDSAALAERRHRIRCETPSPHMAKAKLPDLTLREERAEYGAILRRASEIAGMNRDQTADALKVQPAQISRWWSGDEPAQVWRYRRNQKLRTALIAADAEDATGVIVRTVIEFPATKKASNE